MVLRYMRPAISAHSSRNSFIMHLAPHRFFIVFTCTLIGTVAHVAAMENANVAPIHSSTSTWGDEQPITSFCLGTETIHRTYATFRVFDGIFSNGPIGRLETGLRFDGITFERNGRFYSPDSLKTKSLPDGIHFISDTAGLYGYSYSEAQQTLTFYSLKSIESPEKIWTITNCSSEIKPTDIASLGDYVFIQKKKSLKLSVKPEQKISHNSLPNTVAIQFSGETYILPGRTLQAGTATTKELPTFTPFASESSSLGVPFSMGSQDFFLLQSISWRYDDPYYTIAQTNGKYLKELHAMHCAARTNPLFSLHKNKLFFIKTSKNSSKRRTKEVVYTFDGAQLTKESVLKKDCRTSTITFIDGKLTLYDWSGCATQFREITAQSTAQARAISLLLEKQAPDTADSESVHWEYQKMSRTSYIAHAIPNFFEEPLFNRKLFNYTYNWIRFDHNDPFCMILFLKQVDAVKDMIESHPHKEILKTALKNEFLLRYSLHAQTLCSSQRIALSDKAQRALWLAESSDALLKTIESLGKLYTEALDDPYIYTCGLVGALYWLGPIKAPLLLCGILKTHEKLQQTVSAKIRDAKEATERLGTRYIEHLKKEKKTFSFLFGCTLPKMIEKNPHTLRFSALSALYMKNRSRLLPPQRALYSADLERALDTRPFSMRTPKSLPQVEWLLD